MVNPIRKSWFAGLAATMALVGCGAPTGLIPSSPQGAPAAVVLPESLDANQLVDLPAGAVQAPVSSPTLQHVGFRRLNVRLGARLSSRSFRFYRRGSFFYPYYRTGKRYVPYYYSYGAQTYRPFYRFTHRTLVGPFSVICPPVSDGYTDRFDPGKKGDTAKH